jgi:hypothetical protein
MTDSLKMEEIPTVVNFFLLAKENIYRAKHNKKTWLSGKIKNGRCIQNGTEHKFFC